MLRKLRLKALEGSPSVAPFFHNERIQNGDTGLKRVAKSTERRGWRSPKAKPESVNVKFG
jgi:hypothetical protein